MYQSRSSVTERELKMYLCASPYKNRPNSPGEEGNKILFYPFLTCAVGVSESILHCARSSTHTEEKMCASPCQRAEGCDTACCRPASVAVLPTLRLPRFAQPDAFPLFLAHNIRGELRQNIRFLCSLVFLSPNATNPTLSKQTARWSWLHRAPTFCPPRPKRRRGVRSWSGSAKPTPAGFSFPKNKAPTNALALCKGTNCFPL